MGIRSPLATENPIIIVKSIINKLKKVQICSLLCTMKTWMSGFTYKHMPNIRIGVKLVKGHVKLGKNKLKLFRQVKINPGK